MAISSLFGGGGGPQIRAMQAGDLGAVLRIIHNHDEDDFEEAREDLRESTEGMVVLTKGGKIVGITGANPDPQTDGAAWLSWTYIDVAVQGQGLGRALMQGLIESLKAEGFRKLFISTSDYKDEGEDIYAPARAFYERIGASHEVTIPDYHAPGESRILYGLDITPPPPRTEPRTGGALRFVDMEQAPESEGGLGLMWEADDGGTPPETVDPNLAAMVTQARRSRARVLVAAVPSDLCVNIGAPLQEMGFQHVGRLLDYYEPNVHQEIGILRLT